MKYAVYFKKRPSQAPGVPEHVQEIFAYEVVDCTSQWQLKQQSGREPDEKDFALEAQAKAFAEEMVGRPG